MTKRQDVSQRIAWGPLVLALALLLGVGLVVGLREGEEPTTAGQDFIPTTVLATVGYEGQDGRTAYDLLAASHQVEAEQTDLGILVNRIDGVGGDPNTYWLYYIDGQAAQVASDRYTTESGQHIEWRYEQF